MIVLVGMRRYDYVLVRTPGDAYLLVLADLFNFVGVSCLYVYSHSCINVVGTQLVVAVEA